jgi:membrane protease YdiL (CAAX protease family)
MNNPTPLIKKGWLRAVLFILVFFAGAVSIGLVVGLLTGTTGGSAKAAGNTSVNDTSIYVLLSTLLSVALTAIFRRYIDRRPVASLGFQWDGYQHHAVTGFCLAFALLGMGTLILFFHNNLQWNNVHIQPGDLFIALVMMMLVALGEEMVFRGYILRNLMQSMNKWVALVYTSLLFVIAHAGNPGITSIAVINILLGGLLLGMNYIYTRNLWYALLFHFSWNFFQGPVLGYEVSGINLQSILEPELKGPSWLTGGRFGFEGSIAATIVFIPALLILFLAYERRYSKG